MCWRAVHQLPPTPGDLCRPPAISDVPLRFTRNDKEKRNNVKCQHYLATRTAFEVMLLQTISEEKINP